MVCVDVSPFPAGCTFRLTSRSFFGGILSIKSWTNPYLKALHMTPCKPPTRPLKNWRLLGPNQKFLRWNGCFGHVPTSVKHPKDNFKVKELVTHTCCSQGNKRLNGGWKLFLPSCKHYLILSLDLRLFAKRRAYRTPIQRIENVPQYPQLNFTLRNLLLIQPSKKKQLTTLSKNTKGGGGSFQKNPPHSQASFVGAWVMVQKNAVVCAMRSATVPAAWHLH